MTALPSYARVILSPGMAVVALLGLGYGLYARWMPTDDAGPPGLWDVVVGISTSPQFTTYVAVPAWLLFCVRHTRRTRDHILLARRGSYRRQWIASTGQALRVILCAALVVLVVGYLAAVGLPLDSPGQVVAAFGAIGLAPPVAVFAQLLLQSLTLVCVHSFFLAIRVLLDRAMAAVAIATAIWIWAVVSTTDAIGSASVANAGYFFQFAMVVLDPALGITAIAVALVVLCLSYLIAGELDRATKGRGVDWTNPWGYFGVLAAFIAGLAVAGATTSHASFFDAVELALPGNAGALVQGLPGIFLYVGFAYVFQSRLTRAGEEFRRLQELRYGSVRRWSAVILGRGALKACAFVAGVGLFALLGYLGADGRDFTPPAHGAWIWAYQFGVNGTLQLLLYIVICFGAVVLFRSTLAGTYAIIALLVLSSVPAEPTSWYPFGAAGMARAEFGWAAVAPATASLLICLAIAAVVLYGTALRNPQPRKVRA